MIKKLEFYDDEEKELYESVERGEWVSVENEAEEMKLAKVAANNTIKRLKKKMMSIRLTDKVLEGLKARAQEKGTPYQSLVSTILHQYVTGQFEIKL